MNIEEEVILSYYKAIDTLGDHPNVLLVQHVENGRLFVQKIISAELAEIYARIADLNVHGVPQIYHIVKNESTITIIEEYINGTTLFDYLHENGPLSSEEAIRIARQICDILSPFHRASPPIIHRDIKPSNIILDKDGDVTLVDFDASKSFDKYKNKDTVLIGTADFAAPEQFGFAQSDERTDVYALGVLLNVMLSGKLPSDEQYCCKRKSTDTYCTDAIKKCLQIDPGNRFKNVDALSLALAHGNRPFLPPGFRTRTPWKMIVATIAYLFAIIVSASMTFEGDHSGLWQTENRISVFVIFILAVAIFFDYEGLASALPISRHRNRIISYLGKIMWTSIGMLIVLVLLILFEPEDLL